MAFISLEAAIRFDWIVSGKLPQLTALHQMEEMLSSDDAFEVPNDTELLDAPTRRALSGIGIVRKNGCTHSFESIA